MTAVLALDRNAEITFSGKVNIVVSPPPAPAPQTILRATCAGFSVTATGGHMAYTLPNDKMVDLKISYVDAHNNPAKVDGTVAWVSSDPAIATVAPVTDEPNTDQTLAELKPVGPAGTAQIRATADADLGSGVTELITMFDVEVVGGQAVAGTIAPVGEQQPLP